MRFPRSLAKDIAVMTVSTIYFWLPVRREAMISLRQAHKGWRKNPHRMVAQIITSFIVGQLPFWKVGSDQIGVGMNPVWTTGFGQRVAEVVYPRLAQTEGTAWALKDVETALDYAKCYTETLPYRAHGITPDAVACAIPQPNWSAIEAGEKLGSAISHPERVVSEEGMKLSILCIWGSLVRIVLDLLVYRYGRSINRQLTDRIESGLRAVKS